jgi:hypothetical protein
LRRGGRRRFEVGEQLRRLALRQRVEPEASGRGGRQGGRQPRRRLAGPEGERQQDRRLGASAQQGGDELGRGVVRPVQIVERQDERAIGGQAFEQAAHRPVRPVTLVRDGARLGAGRAAQRRQHLR